MQNQNHPFVELSGGAHVRASDIVAVCIEAGQDSVGQYHRVNVSMSASANSYVHNGRRRVGDHAEGDALAEAGALCAQITAATGHTFVAHTGQWLRADRICSVQIEQISRPRMAWTATVFLDAEGNGRAYRASHAWDRPGMDRDAQHDAAFAAAHADRDRILAALA